MYNKGNESYSYDANFNTKIIAAQLIVGNFSQVSATLRTLKNTSNTLYHDFEYLLGIAKQNHGSTVIRSSRKSCQQRVFKSKAVATVTLNLAKR